MTITRIGVPAASGRLIAACAISSTLSSEALAPAATLPAVNLRNFLRVIVSMSSPYAFTTYSGLHSAKTANSTGSLSELRSAA